MLAERVGLRRRRTDIVLYFSLRKGSWGKGCDVFVTEDRDPNRVDRLCIYEKHMQDTLVTTSLDSHHGCSCSRRNRR